MSLDKEFDPKIEVTRLFESWKELIEQAHSGLSGPDVMRYARKIYVGAERLIDNRDALVSKKAAELLKEIQDYLGPEVLPDVEGE